MIYPILITGFERSGTTLLRRLVSMHPDLEYDLIHEKRQLLSYNSEKEAMNKYHYKAKQAGKETGGWCSIKSGEKVPYIASNDILEYIKRWKDWWHLSHIFHIIRDSKDCAKSAKRVFNKDIEKTIRNYEKSVPIVHNYLQGYTNCTSIYFSELLDNPVLVLKRIYSIIGNCPDDEYINKVLNTKDQWDYKGRVMCGLRYFDKVGNK